MLQTILQHLLDLQGRADRLCERSKLVFPVHLRKISQPAGVLTAQALVSYSHREVKEEIERQRQTETDRQTDRQRHQKLKQFG